MYLETKEKMRLLEVKDMFKRLIKKVVNVQTCKNIGNTIKYITKEDKYPIVFNVDLDKLHIHWKQNNTVELNEFLRIDNYHYNCIPVNYRKDLVNKHNACWTAENSRRDQELAMDYYDPGLAAKLVELSQEKSKRGIYVWGPPGTFKTSSVMAVASVPFFTFNPTSNFPFQGYNGEKDIVWHEFRALDFEKHQVVVQRLTDGYSAPVEMKHGNNQRLRLKGTFFVTSNDSPPVDEAFRRRFHILDVNGDRDELWR